MKSLPLFINESINKKVTFKAFLKERGSSSGSNIIGWFNFAGTDVSYSFSRSGSSSNEKMSSSCSVLLGLARDAWDYLATLGYSGKEQQQAWKELLCALERDVKMTSSTNKWGETKYKPTGIKEARAKMLDGYYNDSLPKIEYSADDKFAGALYPLK